MEASSASSLYFLKESSKEPEFADNKAPFMPEEVNDSTETQDISTIDFSKLTDD